jgi:DNA helicase-2/ATP-dependent DNA helicase PcrA
MFDMRWDAGLNDQQLTAVTHGSDPLVVLAGAGTGKTRVLTSRVAHLLERGIRPERILLLTFTRRAAEEMLSRAAAICGDGGLARRIWGGTFHAVAHKLIGEHKDALGLADVSVLDPGDVTDLMDMLRDEHGLAAVDSGSRRPRPSTLADIYSRSVNTGRPARDVVLTDFPWCEPHLDAVLDLMRGYMTRKRDRGLLDFDDLLLTWRALLTAPVVGDALRERWDHVLVDEYQDVNAIQVDIVHALRPGGVGLTVVGDDAQAVYGFRGATSGHLRRLADELPAACTVPLERNFRSRQSLLDLANEIRPGDDRLRLQADRADPPGRPRRPRLVRCYDVPDEARQIVDAILASVEDGGLLRDHAVLMRAAHHSDLLEVELGARRVPYVKYGGLKFLEAAHVKDFLAALRVQSNVHDEVAWFRLLRLHEGIGPARSRTLLSLLLEAPADVNAVVAAAPPPSRISLESTLRALVNVRAAPVAAQVSAAVGALRPLLQNKYVDSAARIADVDRLAETAGAARTSADLASFVASVTLDPPASTGDFAAPPHIDEDYVTLSTVHSAKGLEWPRVHVIAAVDGAFPSDMALRTKEGLAEEQRLFYVAVTRARDELSIYTPLRMPHHRYARDDKHSFAPQSRFLTPEAVSVMDVCEPPATVAADPGPHVAARVAVPTMEALFD